MERKIAVLANDTTYVYNLRKELLQVLLAQGNTLHIFCQKGQHIEELKQMGCTLHLLCVERHGTNPLKDVGLFCAYWMALKKLRPHAVLTYNIKPNVYGGLACSCLKLPYLPNICGLGTPVENPGLLQKVTINLYRLGVRKAACTFFQNTENEQFFDLHNIAPGPHRLLPGSGVNVKQFQILPYPQDNTTEFLFISRVMKEKGIDQYLEAAQAIHKTHPNTVFHVLGACDDPAYLARLKSLEQQGIIRYHGQQASILPFQTISSCTVHPTYYPEGMSNVLLESAACGRPIITTDRSGCREIIEDGVNGFVCKQRDGADLIRQLEKFLALPWEQRRNMGLAGRAKVEREFDRQLVVDAYLQEIQKAALQSAPRTKTSEEVVAHA